MWKPAKFIEGFWLSAKLRHTGFMFVAWERTSQAHNACRVRRICIHVNYGAAHACYALAIGRESLAPNDNGWQCTVAVYVCWTALPRISPIMTGAVLERNIRGQHSFRHAMAHQICVTTPCISTASMAQTHAKVWICMW